MTSEEIRADVAEALLTGDVHNVAMVFCPECGNLRIVHATGTGACATTCCNAPMYGEDVCREDENEISLEMVWRAAND